MRPFLRVLSCGLIAAYAAGQASRPAARPADERVSVTLKNGETLVGVAPQGVKSERLEGGRFVVAAGDEGPKTGVRLWYYRELDGYLFLEHRRIAKLEVLGALSPAESNELTAALAAARRGREDARRAATLARKAAESRPSPSDEGGEGDAPAAEPTALTEEEARVLAQFPPDRGYSPETFGELKRRSIVLHVYPNAEEQAFLDAFAVWRVAYGKQAALNAAAEAKRGPESSPTPQTPPPTPAPKPEPKPAEEG